VELVAAGDGGEGGEERSDEGMCMTCNIRRLERSQHCKVCGCCMSEHDHHCSWLGVCIARRNYRWFFLYLLVSNISNMLILACCLDLVRLGALSDPYIKGEVIYLITLSTVMFLGLLPLLVFHGNLVRKGRTTCESWSLHAGRSPYVGGGSVSPYDDGWRNNFERVLLKPGPPSQLSIAAPSDFNVL
jgi:palmitoyltransferase ZDHHC9/14/18